MLTRCEVDTLIDSCENNTERLVILAFSQLGLAASEICYLSLFNIIHGRWLVIKDTGNRKRGILLPGNIEKILYSAPRNPKNPREVREIVLTVAGRAGIKATPTDLRRFFDNKHERCNN